MNIWWSPGQSDASKEICRHLNRREKAGLFGLSLSFGLCAFAIPMVIMGLATGIGPFHERLEGFAFPLFVCLVAGAWIILTLQRRLLLGTQVAKDNRFTMADLNARHPPSRGDYLTLGGIAALAVTVALAGFLTAFLIAA